MSSQQPDQPTDPRVVIVDPEGQPGVTHEDDDQTATDPTSLVEEPAKVIRIGRMIQHLLEEVKSAPVDEPGRTRLASLLHASITELKEGLAPQLDEELDRLVAPFESETPTESELRIAQATLAGWLEGLFHGIQSAIYTQQMAARAQLEQMRALPPGVMEQMRRQAGQADDPGAALAEQSDRSSGGMYL
ncbi:MAG TPA: proteasome activator [Marmoricola sp.]|nr:proteasome activator [Marmoricola sp.]